MLLVSVVNLRVRVQFSGQDQENAERMGKGQDLGLGPGTELANNLSFSIVTFVVDGYLERDNESECLRSEPVFARGSAFYDLTVAKDPGPYADNPNNRHWLPQTTSHVRLPI